MLTGYCQITCGRCNCCKNFKDVLSDLGATTLLAAAQAANLTNNLTDPGTMWTLLAPTNAAFAEYLVTAGADISGPFAAQFLRSNRGV